jgi:hypothetical protein
VRDADIIENDFNGLLIPPADAAALEEAIVRLANCEDLRRKLGMAASETMERFTWERTARMVEALFQTYGDRGRTTRRMNALEIGGHSGADHIGDKRWGCAR